MCGLATTHITNSGIPVTPASELEYDGASRHVKRTSGAWAGGKAPRPNDELASGVREDVMAFWASNELSHAHPGIRLKAA